MAKASDNVFPKLIVAEGTAPASPSAGQQKLYLDSADHKLKRVNSVGAVTIIEGGGSSSATKMPLDPTTPLDNFAGSSLDPAWSVQGSYVSGDYTVADSWLACTNPRFNNQYFYRTPPVGWTVMTAKMCALSPTSGTAFGLMAVDNTGAGVGASACWNGAPDALFEGVLAGGNYGSVNSTSTVIPASFLSKGTPHWIRLRRSGTNYFLSASVNGVNWSTETAALSSAVTVTRIGFGAWFNTAAPASFGLDWFDAA